MAEHTHDETPVRFETHPSRYTHWKLDFPESFGGRVARLSMDVQEEGGLRPGYVLKLNSYDLGVDVELADAIQRVRFEHPAVRALVVTSAKDRIFCSGANIYMLGSSTHAFKVNFCKYTNETRLGIEDLSEHTGVQSLAALAGTASGGGYELAIACNEIVLQEDGSSAVSYPETPLLAVLPGTGGLTRLTDKRKVRRDRADVFATLAEGMRGKRAVQWGLIDKTVPRSRFADTVTARAKELAALAPPKSAAGPEAGVTLEPLTPTLEAATVRYRFVELRLDRPHRLAHLTVTGPAAGSAPQTAAELHAQAARGELWALRAFRELDDALLRLRFHEPTIGLVLVHTRGELAAVQEADARLWALRDYWLGREVILNMARVLRRLDQTARSLFAIGEKSSCFGGCLLELLLAADRSYCLEDSAIALQPSALSGGALPVLDGRTRLQLRCFADPSAAAAILERGAQGPIPAAEADELGLLTFLLDELDFDDTLRLAIEERVSLSPDALTGMEQNLRFPGAEASDCKIFGRLSAWQNWIFIRDNATGEKGALSSYGKPERPSFDWRRT